MGFKYNGNDYTPLINGVPAESISLNGNVIYEGDGGDGGGDGGGGGGSINWPEDQYFSDGWNVEENTLPTSIFDESIEFEANGFDQYSNVVTIDQYDFSEYNSVIVDITFEGVQQIVTFDISDISGSYNIHLFKITHSNSDFEFKVGYSDFGTTESDIIDFENIFEPLDNGFSFIISIDLQ